MPNRMAAAMAIGLILDAFTGEAAHFTQELTNPITDVRRPSDEYETTFVVG